MHFIDDNYEKTVMKLYEEYDSSGSENTEYDCVMKVSSEILEGSNEVENIKEDDSSNKVIFSAKIVLNGRHKRLYLHEGEL